MPATYVTFGPGTLVFNPGATPNAFECEVKGGGVKHEYEDVGEKVTYLCGDSTPASQVRSDSLEFEIDNDLTAAGMYQYLVTNDLTEAPFEYVPNTDSGAKWAGSVQLRLPDEVMGDEFGAKISGKVTLLGVGLFTFTPAA